MIFVCFSEYKTPIDPEGALLGEHRAWLAVQLDAGRLVAAGRRSPSIGGVIIFRGEDEAEVQSLIDQDPFVRDGAAEYNLHGFQPTITALPGLAD